MLELDRLNPADPGGNDAAEPHRVVRKPMVPAGIPDRLRRGDDRELREPVEPPDLLDRQEF